MLVRRNDARVAVCLAACLWWAAGAQAAPRLVQADGFATQNGGVTGGGDAKSVTVATPDELRAAIAGDEPAVIVVQGQLDAGGVRVGSNKTLLGADSKSGLSGGTVRVDGRNCIFQNLVFGPARGDVFEVSGGQNVFITRCEFFGSSDELCSIVRGADFVTVSWCKFHFPDPDSHSFPHLIGNSDSRTSDRGKLRVTMHHNWYDAGCRSRMPRVRFGRVHLYNNYYACHGNNYCIGTGVESRIRVERSVFDDVNRPWNDMGGMDRKAEIGWRDLEFIGCQQPTYAPNRWPVFETPYDYQPDELADVKTLVTDERHGAGNKPPRP
ncbi:Pectate trisaccharide-lyase precursor [Posidoniimonas corsicana]|uniref:Pectate trisaccharide-lyase n=1 Tax=Posidoniimonas corsicana TaxID=1938618 RepID=A0A5C5UXL7_9BACT|nr:hypothetical protein [Posidoniimonas corsicana]TWT30212.1 Pectate trisaccharide-lyase precursor [Posidoniimonas corsicana]